MIPMMEIFVNDVAKEIPEGSTIQSLVAVLGLSPAGLAIALDDAVVPRSQWATRIVHANARILVLTASQGG